jgi:hypothetical protein
VVFVAVVAVYSWTRRPPDPDDIERRRRAYLNQIGRIVEGHIIEIVESPGPEKAPSSIFARKKSPPSGAAAKRTLICYSYSISGVSYETAQDVTGLQARAAIQRMAAGQHASVKYDPANPGNSILMADDWSGFH